MATVISIAAQKGGTGKSTTTASLGVGLARLGKRVLLCDMDPQHSLSVSLGIQKPGTLPVTMATIMGNIVNDTEFDPVAGIIHHKEGIDFLPANISLAGMELSLVSVMGRESITSQYIDKVGDKYDFIILDTAPSLGLLTINALASSDFVIVPVAPKFLDVKGLELLLKSISQVRQKINPRLSIGGILFTLVDKRANFTREIIGLIETTYGGKIRIFSEHIPRSVRTAESSAHGKSIYSYDPHGKVAAAYAAFTREVLEIA